METCLIETRIVIVETDFRNASRLPGLPPSKRFVLTVQHGVDVVDTRNKKNKYDVKQVKLSC